MKQQQKSQKVTNCEIQSNSKQQTNHCTFCFNIYPFSKMNSILASLLIVLIFGRISSVQSTSEGTQNGIVYKQVR
jgi:hypothetical protein